VFSLFKTIDHETTIKEALCIEKITQRVKTKRRHQEENAIVYAFRNIHEQGIVILFYILTNIFSDTF